MTDGSSQGLFAVVAVVIFGIFVSISYLLFRDQLTHSLANIFEDSINQTNNYMNDVVDLTGIEQNESVIIAQIQKESETQQNIWAKFKKIEGGLALIETSLDGIKFSATGDSKMVGDLILPDTINNLPIIEFSGEYVSDSIIHGSFFRAKFNGKLKLPKYLKKLNAISFPNSTFTGSLVLPSTLEYIGRDALINSEFTGRLELPKSLQSIGGSSFSNSKFTGELIIPKNFKSLGGQYFVSSKFSKVTLENPDTYVYHGDIGMEENAENTSKVVVSIWYYEGFEGKTIKKEIYAYKK